MGNNERKYQKGPLRLEVCGGIAAGKTTFVTLLKVAGFKPIFENYLSNPFLRSFYINPEKYAFETETSFLLQHYHQIKYANVISNKIACDYSLYLDLAYSSISLSESQLQTFKSVYQQIRQEVSIPQLLIYLECSAKTELSRIHGRNRSFEQNIDIKFLENLNNAIEELLEDIKYETRVVKISSERINFATDQEDKNYVIDVLRSALLEIPKTKT